MQTTTKEHLVIGEAYQEGQVTCQEGRSTALKEPFPCCFCGREVEKASMQLVYSIDGIHGYYCRTCYAEHCRKYR
jgi:hypothetical protein